MNSNKLIISLLSLVFSLLIIPKAFSQGKDSTKIIVYDAFNTNTSIDSKEDIVYPENLVKWNIAMLARGAFEMDYERCLSDKFTVEVGAGITYFDPFYSIYSEISGFGYSTYSGDRTLKYGPLFAGALRFYPDDVTGFEGLYVSIPLRYRAYVSDVEVTYTNSNNGVNNIITNTFKNNHSHFEYGFTVGYQSGNYYDLVWDYFIGVGINTNNSTFPAYDDNSIPFQYSEKKSKPTFFLGFKMGLPFK
ncbi:MAG: hypothetical protein CVU05_02905 [Bacteroidetes bacterium HGW-Bacteroidetes-21]|jgi:hypothetical protein|nr:MAG: hypothetical protein CVU05_02905 [Bacteroidetes bacterium HGW-Bacteroidetes-21]